MLARTGRVVVQQKRTIQRGMAKRGWMNGHEGLDELAGRRETTYKGWEWNSTTLFEVGMKFVLPSLALGVAISVGARNRRERQGLV